MKTKEDIDKLMQVFLNGDIDSINEFLPSGKLKDKIMNAENVEEVIEKNYEQLIEQIISQIPKNFLNYLYARSKFLKINDFEVPKECEYEVEKLLEEQISNVANKINNLSNKEEKVRKLKDYEDTGVFYRIVKEIEDDEVKAEIIGEMVGRYDEISILEVTKTLKNYELRFQVLDNLGDYTLSFSEVLTYGQIRLNSLEDLYNEDKIALAKRVIKKEFVKAFINDEEKLQVLDEFNNDEKIEILKTIESQEVIFKYIDITFKDDKKNEILKRMYLKNRDVITNIKHELLDDKYISVLGEDKINFISCFENIQYLLLDIDDTSIKILSACIDIYEQNSNNEGWTTVAENILQNIGDYSELFKDLEQSEKIDFDKLLKILQDENLFNIKTTKDLKKFNQIRREQCDKWINGDLGDRKKAVLYKIFGQSLSYTKSIIRRFGEDIENIDDGAEKDFVKCLKEIIEIDDLDVLDQIYKSVDEIEVLDKTTMEGDIKSAYFKKYKEGLLQPEELQEFDKGELPDELKELKVYDSGTEFKMIITSVAAYLSNNPKDYKKDWNRPSLESRTFLCKLYKK